MRHLIPILQIGLLSLIYLIGSWLQEVLHLPLPGSIVGLLFLLLGLHSKLLTLQMVEKGAHALLYVLPLFFVPATVAVMKYGHIFSGSGILLVVIVIISTGCTMIVASYVGQLSAKSEESQKCR